MFVAATTECYRDLELNEAIDRLVDLEYVSVELDIHETGKHLRPSQVAADLDGAIDLCLNTRRLNVIAFSVEIAAQGEEYFSQFEKICQLSKATKVVTLSVPSGELGTPFNEEVERLREMVKVAERHGVRVGVKNRIGCLTEDPDTVMVMCEHVKGLGLSLDPSHYICGPYAHRDFKKLYKYVYHVNLRDSKKGNLNVLVGQGEIDYTKLIAHLEQVNYDRALVCSLEPIPGVDHMQEMRKMRLLLESML